MTPSATADPIGGGPLSEPLDEQEVLPVWRQLANESLMFPLDMDIVAAKIGPERQLFVDNALIARASNVRREVHQPERYAGNPVLPAAGNAHAFVLKVLPFDESPHFRMWYWSISDWHAWGQGNEIRSGMSYAVSDDGIHWERPQLNLHRVEGIEEENIVLPYGLMHGVFYEPWEEDPRKRFKGMVVVSLRKQGQRGVEGLVIPEAYYLYTSPDGIHWTCDGEFSKPILPYLRGRNYPQNGVGDTSRFWWDPHRSKYIGDVKFVLPGTIRCRGIMESDDLVHWTRPHPTFASRNPDHQIYGHTAFPYEGMYIGVHWIYEPEHPVVNHCMPVELDCSRDGKYWTRVGAGQSFMALNPKRDTWDCDQMKITSMLRVGDELWLYYAANQGYMSAAKAHTGLAKLRLDGFASINAGTEEGRLLTRPLGFSGRHLHVNAEVAPDGELRVGFVKQDGASVEGFSPDDCEPITADSIDIPVEWKDGRDMRALANSDVRLDFRLRNAKLYSFWIST
ncbi:MAG: hypothetical protein CL878_01495 [Dehalococcoidia bacterium]|nr:hypothetical protein [Dehalococcoidia bacterium]